MIKKLYKKISDSYYNSYRAEYRKTQNHNLIKWYKAYVYQAKSEGRKAILNDWQLSVLFLVSTKKEMKDLEFYISINKMMKIKTNIIDERENLK